MRRIGLDFGKHPAPPTVDGMSLRDWFAGQALTGLVAFDRPSGTGGHNQPIHFARWSYAIADAILAERAKGGA